jgi:transposase
LPPDVREWLPADHLAWFVIDAVGEMDLSAFSAAYRADGHGRAAYEPSLMVALILYAFATRVRSSRAIECHCRQDVAYRVITGNLVADHATMARFICRHERGLAELFAAVLRLCDRAGLVKPGWCRSTAPGSRGTPARRSTTSSSRSPGRSWPRPGSPTRPRRKRSARRVVMSCPSSCAPLRVGASSCAGPVSRCAASRSALSRPASPRPMLQMGCRLSST